jgi:hypothetical protein
MDTYRAAMKKKDIGPNAPGHAGPTTAEDLTYNPDNYRGWNRLPIQHMVIRVGFLVVSSPAHHYLESDPQLFFIN